MTTRSAAPASSTTPVVPRAVSATSIRMPQSRSLRFEGRDHGSEVSFFLVDSAPGEGPDLHWHSYTETWTVLEGEAMITMGGHTLVARTGDTAVVQPYVWHRFVNSGIGRLKIMCMHASDRLVSEFEADPPA